MTPEEIGTRLAHAARPGAAGHRRGVRRAGVRPGHRRRAAGELAATRSGPPATTPSWPATSSTGCPPSTSWTTGSTWSRTSGRPGTGTACCCAPGCPGRTPRWRPWSTLPRRGLARAGDVRDVRHRLRRARRPASRCCCRRSSRAIRCARSSCSPPGWPSPGRAPRSRASREAGAATRGSRCARRAYRRRANGATGLMPLWLETADPGGRAWWPRSSPCRWSSGRPSTR